MSRGYYTECNVCGARTFYSEPRGWTSITFFIKELGTRAEEKRQYADVCSERCKNRWIAEKLQTLS